MRNLKKFLALVLAMMMVFSLMVTVNAASNSEASDEASEAAAEQLGNYRVLEGYDGKLHLDESITRAQMAAIVYRIMTGDVKDEDGNDNSITNFGAYAGLRFSDVGEANWARGYIGFCVSQGILVGYGDGKVHPNEPITGYQVQTMLLRAVGYGQNHEYEGSDWRYNVATDAAKHSIYAITTGTNYDPNVACPRGIVAQMTLHAATETNMVRYNASSGQYSNITTANRRYLITDDRNTDGSVTYTNTDYWGIPIAEINFQFNWTDKPVTKDSDGNDLAYALKAPVLAEYWEPMTECDVADELDFDDDVTVRTYTNGLRNTSNTKIEPLDEEDTIGAQGRWTRIFDQNENGEFDSGDCIVYIDTLLAKVTDVTDATFDGKEHLDDPASLELEVYTGRVNSGSNNGSTWGDGKQTITVTNGDENYTYAIGDYLLINAVASTSSANILAYGTNKHIEVIEDDPDTLVSAQTKREYDPNAHTLSNGYNPDNNRYHLDKAGETFGTKYTWFFDTKGNVIGSDNVISTYDYGVVENIEWEGSRLSGHAEADLRMIDGTPMKDVVIGSINGLTPALLRGDNDPLAEVGDTIYISDWYQQNEDINEDGKNTAADGTFVNNELFAITFDDDGVAYLDKYDSDETTGIGHIASTTVTKGNSDVGGVMSQSSATRYLIRTGSYGKYKYETVTGYNNISTLTGAHVDYVNGATNNYAKYVFMYGTEASTSSTGLVYVLKGTWGVTANSYTVEVAYLNGDTGTVTVSKNDKTLADTLVAGVGTLFFVEYDGSGKAVTAVQIPAYDDGYLTLTGSLNNLRATYIDDAYWTDDVLADTRDPDDANVKFNVTDTTVIYGTKPTANGGRIVNGAYVVYNSSNKASYIYIPDDAPNITGLMYDEMNAEELAQYLDDNDNKIGAGVTIFLTPEEGQDPFTAPVTVEEGGSLVIDGDLESDSKVTVEDGGSLEVGGAINSEVEVQGAGSLKADSIEEGADVTVSLDSIVDIDEWNEAAKISDDPVTNSGKLMTDGVGIYGFVGTPSVSGSNDFDFADADFAVVLSSKDDAAKLAAAKADEDGGKYILIITDYDSNWPNEDDTGSGASAIHVMSNLSNAVTTEARLKDNVIWFNLVYSGSSDVETTFTNGIHVYVIYTTGTMTDNGTTGDLQPGETVPDADYEIINDFYVSGSFTVSG